MSGTDALDDASADNERFEAELVAQDQDAARVAVADIDDGRAHSLVNDLVDDVVIPIPDERVLVHEPSDEAFDSILQLAVFHRGWTAARDAGEGGQ
jgi:hypothetical protein